MRTHRRFHSCREAPEKRLPALRRAVRRSYRRRRPCSGRAELQPAPPRRICLPQYRHAGCRRSRARQRDPHRRRDGRCRWQRRPRQKRHGCFRKRRTSAGRPSRGRRGWFLPYGGVVRTGEDDRGVRFKGVIQLDFVAVRIGEGGGERDGGGRSRREPSIRERTVFSWL